jgi:RNA polymerase sigma-70 factor (ECF subfamily)
VNGDLAEQGHGPATEEALQTASPHVAHVVELRNGPGRAGEPGDFDVVPDSGHVADETQGKEGLARIAYFEALRIVRNHHDAQDLAGEAMVRFLASPVVPDTPGAWIRTVAHHLALDQVRRNDRFQQVAPLLVDPDQPFPDERLLAVELLTDALALLPRKQKQALSLYYFERLDRAAVAKRMGVSSGTVKTHLARALVTLKAYFEANDRGDQ